MTKANGYLITSESPCETLIGAFEQTFTTKPPLRLFSSKSLMPRFHTWEEIEPMPDSGDVKCYTLVDAGPFDRMLSGRIASFNGSVLGLNESDGVYVFHAPLHVTINFGLSRTNDLTRAYVKYFLDILHRTDPTAAIEKTHIRV